MAKKNNVITYHSTAKSILLAAIKEMCGDASEFKLLPGNDPLDSDKELQALIEKEKKNAHKERRDPQVVKVPYVWSLASSMDHFCKIIEAHYWDLNNPGILLDVQNFIINPTGDKLDIAINAAVSIREFDRAMKALPDGHLLKVVEEEEGGQEEGQEKDSKPDPEAEKKGKAYENLINKKGDGGKDGLKKVGKDLKK